MLQNRRIKRLSLLAVALAAGHALAQPMPELPSGTTQKTAVSATNAMVAAAHPLAVAAGHAMLAAGGTAVDAMIATQLALNVVEPQSSGIGGGAFLLVHDGATQKLRAYDGRETAPRAAKEDRFMGGDGKPLPFYEQVVGGESVGTPGTVKLLAHAHAAHGKLPWAQLFAPAITLAEEGFAVTPRLHMAIRTDRFLKDDTQARAVFFDAQGAPLAVGATLKNAALGITLRRLAEKGDAAFYAGALPDKIIAAVKSHRNPGDLTAQDFADYRVVERTPVCGPYRGFSVCGMPAPSSGGVAIVQMLGMLARFSGLGVTKLPSAQMAFDLRTTHLISEAARLAYADRNRYLADPAFAPQPAWLTAPGYIASRSALIDEAKSMNRAQPGVESAPKVLSRRIDDRSYEFNATSHVSIVDAHGNAVSLTTTIEDTMGARLMVEGFLLNNELTDFSAVAREGDALVANRIEPGKRPRSTMAPTIIYDAKGDVFMVTGSPGGSAIINYVVKTIIGVIDAKLDPQAAIDLPNIGSRNGPTEIEKGSAAETLIPQLKALGHEPRVLDFTSGLHTIVRSKNGWTAGADPRREGTARGL